MYMHHKLRGKLDKLGKLREVLLQKQVLGGNVHHRKIWR